ncbi:MAG: T9SS type A sorting domain-containing protein [Saprospiraceae bacterium]
MNLFRLVVFCLGFLFIACNEKNKLDRDGEDEKQSGAGIAMDEWVNVRFSNSDQVSSNALIDAQQKVKTNFRAADKAKWKALGPMNIGGRTLCLAFHPTDPDVIFAGSASGGLWKTSSSGKGYHGWIQVPINFPVYSIASILISPKNPNIIFLGTGEVYNKDISIPGIVDRTTRGTYGMGILKSEDGGLSWSQVLQLSKSIISGVQDLKFDPYDDQIIYAATTEGLYKTTSQGRHWILVQDVPMAVDIEINPNNPEIIYVTHGSLNDESISGIYKSNNSGASFVKLSNGLPAEYTGKAKIAISKTNPDILYASIANHDKSIGLFMTVDGGASWDLMNAQDAANVQGWYSHDIAIDPSDPSVVSYVGQNAYFSSNSGRYFTNATSWDAGDMGRIPVGGKEGDESIYVHADIHATYFHPLRPNEIYFATDGGIFVSPDRGLTFQGRNGGYQTTQFYANFSASKQDPKFAIGGMQDNGTAIYDGQDGWIKVIGGDGMSTAILGTNENIIYGTYQYFGLNKSTDHGKSFEIIRPSNNAFLSETKAFNTPFEITISNPSALYAGAQRVYINENNGDPNGWKALHANPLDANAAVLALAVSPADPTLLMASTSPINNTSIPKVFRSTNGGGNWQTITGLPTRAAMDISFDPNNTNIVYTVFSGFGANTHVYKSIDAGLNWNSIENGLPDVPTNSIVVSPKNSKQVYVGNDLGVFVSNNGGASWEKFMAGLPNAVLAMSLSISAEAGLIKVATHGNGVYESPLADLTIATKEITNPDLKKFLVSPNPAVNNIRINTQFSQKANYSVQLIDMNGKMLSKATGLNASLGENNTSLDISALPSGVYTIILEGKIISNQSGFYLNKRVIKN